MYQYGSNDDYDQDFDEDKDIVDVDDSSEVKQQNKTSSHLKHEVGENRHNRNQLSYTKLNTPGGKTNYTNKSFHKTRHSSRSKGHLKNHSSHSYSYYGGENSIQSINGAETFLSRYTSNKSFEQNHLSVMSQVKADLEKSTRMRTKVNNDLDEVEQFQGLNAENQVLRKSLKNLNLYLTKFLETLKKNKLKKMHSLSYKYGSNGKLKKSRDEKIKISNLEADNYQKMLSNMTADYDRTKQRLFQVQDHNYVLNLRNEIKEAKHTIEQLKKNNKATKDEQFGQEKKLAKIIIRGSNDAMEQIQEGLKNLTVLNDKKHKLETIIEKQQNGEAIIEMNTKRFEQELHKLEEEAKAKGLSLKSYATESVLRPRNSHEVENLRKSVERHSLNAIHRKFFTKIFHQKEKLTKYIKDHNYSIEIHNSELQKLDENYT